MPERSVSQRGEEMNFIDEIDAALDVVNQHHWWILSVFLLASSPGMFNAYHIMVSNFLAFVPAHWCRVPELDQVHWTTEQIKNISMPNATKESSCTMLAWNYTMLANMGYEKALDYVSSNPKPLEEICKEFVFEEKVQYASTVSEWNLVCERKIYKSNVQGSIAAGKLVGGFLFGAIADKFGRKISFVLSCLTYIVFAPLAAFAPNLWVFIMTRFFIGIGGSGCYETGFTIVAELVTKSRRAALGCVYNLSYPLGYMSLPVIAFMFPKWRELQLAISLPLLFLFFHCWFLPESPRWLITQGKKEKAWRVIQRVDDSLQPQSSGDGRQEEFGSITGSLFSRIIGSSQKVLTICSTAELVRRILIAYFAWFVAALSYYVLGLNAVNFDTNQYMYTFLSGLVEIPGYSMPLLLLLWLGRKTTTALLYLISGSALLSICVIPKDMKILVLVVAMIGRLTDVAVFGVVVVYTSELFPTTVRNSAIGSSLAISQLGSIYAPYIVDILGARDWRIPSTLCGVMALACAMLVLLLPETRGKPLTDTIEEIKSSPQKDKVSISNCCKFT